MSDFVFSALQSHDYLALKDVSSSELEAVFLQVFQAYPQLKLQCIQAIVELGQSTFYPYLNVALQDIDPLVRERAAKELGFCQCHFALSPLIQTLIMDSDVKVKAAAAQALGSLRSPKGVSALLMSLESQNQSLLSQTCLALAKIPSKRNLRPLSRLIDRSSNEVVLLDAISAIGQISTVESLTLLLQMLNDKRPQIRSAALIALGQKQEEWLQKYFEILGSDSDTEVRRSAYWASSLQETERSELFLKEAVKHICYGYLETAKRVLDMYDPRSPYF